MITFQIAKLNISKPNAKLQKHSISKLDPNKFTSLLNDKNVEDILNCNDPNVAISKFEDYVKDAQTQSTSTKIIKDNTTNAWFDSELIKLRRKRQIFYKRFRTSRTLKNERAYKDINKFYEKKIIEKKKNYLKKLFDKHRSNSRQTWALVNKLLGRSKNKAKIHSIEIDGNLETKEDVIANEFNKFFASVPKCYHDKLPKMSKSL